MNKAQFDYMCENYGDPTLPSDEMWKSVAYIATTTTKVPTFSAQYYLRTNQLQYSEDFNEPGFFLTDYLYSPHGPFSNEQGLVVTFIPLSMITAIAFTSKTSFREEDGSSSTVIPEEPDVIIGAESVDAEGNDVYTIIDATGEDEDNGADPNVEYNTIFTGTGANTVDDDDIDLEYPTTVMDAADASGEGIEMIFSLDENGANPEIETGVIYDGNE